MASHFSSKHEVIDVLGKVSFIYFLERLKAHCCPSIKYCHNKNQFKHYSKSDHSFKLHSFLSVIFLPFATTLVVLL